MSAQQKQKILRAFRNADINGDGELSRAEVMKVLSKLDPVTNQKAVGGISKWSRLVDAVDADHNGHIDVHEFIEWLCGRNVQVKHIVAEIDLVTLRVRGCSKKTPEEVRACFEVFGPLKHLHHVQGADTNTIVFFHTEVVARAAFSAFFKTKSDAQAVLEKATAEEDPRLHVGGTVANSELVCFSADERGSVTLAAATCSKTGPMPVPQNFFKELEDTIHKLGRRIHGDTSWANRARASHRTCSTLPPAAKLLRTLSMSVDEFRPDLEDDVLNWRVTMQAMAKGQLDFLDPESINGALHELVILTEGAGDGSKLDHWEPKRHEGWA